MNKQESLEHQARLELAICLATAKDGSPQMKKKLLKSILQKDKVVRRIFETYGVKA